MAVSLIIALNCAFNCIFEILNVEANYNNWLKEEMFPFAMNLLMFILFLVVTTKKWYNNNKNKCSNPNVIYTFTKERWCKVLLVATVLSDYFTRIKVLRFSWHAYSNFIILVFELFSKKVPELLKFQYLKPFKLSQKFSVHILPRLWIISHMIFS